MQIAEILAKASGDADDEDNDFSRQFEAYYRTNESQSAVLTTKNGNKQNLLPQLKNVKNDTKYRKNL